MARTRYFSSLAHERFAPEELLAQAVAAERAGFDSISCSDHWHDPAAMQSYAQATVTDEELQAPLDVHAERIREVEKLDATVVVLMNVSAADPLGAVSFCGEHVLPRLRGR